MGLVSTDDFLPIAGAAVGIPSTGDETSTDEMGAFALGPLVPGDYTVIAQRLGFDPMAKKVTVYPGKETELAFVLETQPAPGPYHVTDPQVVLVEAFMWKLTPECIYTTVNPLVKTCGGVRTGCDGQCELSYDEGEDETWMTLLGEVRWEQQTGVTGRGFHFDLNAPNIERGQGGSINQDNPYTFQKATDQSPIILRIDNPVTLEERQIAQEDYYGQWFYRVFAAACDLGICPDGFGPDYGIMQDGRAEIYVTWFFEEPAEPGWTALSDG